MDFFGDIDFKSVVFGAAISAACVIIGSWGGNYQMAYPFAAIGLIYVGYKSNSIKSGTILGAFASTPIAYLAFDGYFGIFSGFFATDVGYLALLIIILLVGAFIGFVGAWAKRDRLKAKQEYEKKQKIGKNKKKKKGSQQPDPQKTANSLVNKIRKKI